MGLGLRQDDSSGRIISGWDGGYGWVEVEYFLLDQPCYD